MKLLSKGKCCGQKDGGLGICFLGSSSLHLLLWRRVLALLFWNQIWKKDQVRQYHKSLCSLLIKTHKKPGICISNRFRSSWLLKLMHTCTPTTAYNTSACQCPMVKPKHSLCYSSYRDLLWCQFKQICHAFSCCYAGKLALLEPFFQVAWLLRSKQYSRLPNTASSLTIVAVPSIGVTVGFHLQHCNKGVWLVDGGLEGRCAVVSWGRVGCVD